MDPFQNASIQAAIRADFGGHLVDEQWLRIEDGERRRAGQFRAGFFGRLFGPWGAARGREAPDALGLQAFIPPL